MDDAKDTDRRSKRPVIEWIVGGISLLITFGLIGFIGWNAMQGPLTKPQISLHVTGIEASGEFYLVEFKAFNHGDQTAADVAVEGHLSAQGQETEIKGTTLDYLPGQSHASGGLFFRSDPRKGNLRISAVGYQLP